MWRYLVLSWICCTLRCGGGNIVGDRPGTRCDGPEQILQSLQGSWKYHGQQVAGVPGLDGEAPGLLQFEFHWFFSSYGSGRSLYSLGRSVEKNQLRYTTVICDGDAKTILRLNNEHPYGSDVVIEVITFMLILFIFMVIVYIYGDLFTFMVITYLYFFVFFWHLQKMECVGHIQKRLGKKNAWPKEEDLCWWQWSSEENKVGREGCLTESVINTLIGLLWRGYLQFSRGRGWNVQSGLGSVPQLNIWWWAAWPSVFPNRIMLMVQIQSCTRWRWGNTQVHS